MINWEYYQAYVGHDGGILIYGQHPLHDEEYKSPLSNVPMMQDRCGFVESMAERGWEICGEVPYIHANVAENSTLGAMKFKRPVVEKPIQSEAETIAFWAGAAGDEYHQRNRVDFRLRERSLFNGIMGITNARSILEVGCGPGWNLNACKLAAWNRASRGEGNPWVETYGIEINPTAARQATLAGHAVMIDPITHPAHPLNAYDLVMSVGCLIHIPPAELEATMRGMVNASAQWVLVAEYHAEQEEMVEYRGEKDRLWKRNYGQLCQDLGLKHHMSGFLTPEQGFDNVTWWLGQK